MRTTAKVVGIVGGAIALVVSLFFILTSLTFMNSNLWGYLYDTSEGLDNIISKSDYITQVAAGGSMFLIPGICAAISGVLGLVGGIIVKKKNIASGVLMIIAAVLSLFSFFNIVSMVLFILGGIFALKREPHQQQQAYAPPYPMPPYYPQTPYPPQQIPQQYPQQSAPPQEQPTNPPENPQP